MTEDDMDALLRSYGPNVVPTLDQVRLDEKPGDYRFDGSFGWAIGC